MAHWKLWTQNRMQFITLIMVIIYSTKYVWLGWIWESHRWHCHRWQPAQAMPSQSQSAFDAHCGWIMLLCVYILFPSQSSHTRVFEIYYEQFVQKYLYLVRYICHKSLYHSIELTFWCMYRLNVKHFHWLTFNNINAHLSFTTIQFKWLPFIFQVRCSVCEECLFRQTVHTKCWFVSFYNQQNITEHIY